MSRGGAARRRPARRAGGRGGPGLGPAAGAGAGGGQGHAVPAQPRAARAAPRPQVRQPARGQGLARAPVRLQPVARHGFRAGRVRLPRAPTLRTLTREPQPVCADPRWAVARRAARPASAVGCPAWRQRHQSGRLRWCGPCLRGCLPRAGYQADGHDSARLLSCNAFRARARRCKRLPCCCVIVSGVPWCTCPVTVLADGVAVKARAPSAGPNAQACDVREAAGGVCRRVHRGHQPSVRVSACGRCALCALQLSWFHMPKWREWPRTRLLAGGRCTWGGSVQGKARVLAWQAGLHRAGRRSWLQTAEHAGVGCLAAGSHLSRSSFRPLARGDWALRPTLRARAGQVARAGGPRRAQLRLQL